MHVILVHCLALTVCFHRHSDTVMCHHQCGLDYQHTTGNIVHTDYDAWWHQNACMERKVVLSARQWTRVILYSTSGEVRIILYSTSGEVRISLKFSHTFDTEAQFRLVCCHSSRMKSSCCPFLDRHRNAFRCLWPASANMGFLPCNIY
jgi:hypothetical protein